jgi:hypothetical protein
MLTTSGGKSYEDVSKQRTHSFDTERFNLQKLNKAEDNEQYSVDILSRLPLMKT